MAAARDTFADFALDQLAGLGGVVARPMFGGHGLYRGGVFFGILFKGRLYFKVGIASRAAYLEAGMKPFRPGKGRTLKSFYEVPPDVLESPPRLTDWARVAVLAAGRKAR